MREQIMTTVTIQTTGTIKWINEAKGFGIIAPHAGGKNLFANFPVRNAGDKPGGLKIKQKVSYDVKSGPDGDQAVNVKTIA
jgi:cold shock protein